MYKIQVVGAGYLGSSIAGYFHSKNQKVTALTRDPSKASELKKRGILPIVADLTKPGTLDRVPDAQFIVICPAPDARSAEAYRRIYVEGVANFLKAVKRHPRPLLVLYVSSTAVWGERGGEWVDEFYPPEPDTDRGKILLEAEAQVLASGFPAAVVRLGGIYGPGRNRIKLLKEGRWPRDAENKYLNMIHVTDVVNAVPVLFKRAEAGAVYAGVDDQPAAESELYHWLCARLKLPVTKQFSVDTPVRGKRLRNSRLKALGVSLEYPTYREGYSALIPKSA